MNVTGDKFLRVARLSDRVYFPGLRKSQFASESAEGAIPVVDGMGLRLGRPQMFLKSYGAVRERLAKQN